MNLNLLTDKFNLIPPHTNVRVLPGGQGRSDSVPVHHEVASLSLVVLNTVYAFFPSILVFVIGVTSARM